MRIEGDFEFIERVKVRPPNDGVHVAGQDGWLKGSHAVLWDGKLIPKGRVGMYVRNKQNTGVKVYWSLSWRKGQRAAYANRMMRKWLKLYKLGIAVQPHKVVGVKVNVTYRGKRHKGQTVGIKADHVHYPEDAWRNYMYGHPYDWNALDATEHPNHCPSGFRKFVKAVKSKMEKAGITMDCSFKLGDTVYCTKKKRWFVVDISE